MAKFLHFFQADLRDCHEIRNVPFDTSSLPTEILQERFFYTTDEDLDSNANFVLGQVCRH